MANPSYKIPNQIMRTCQVICQIINTIHLHHRTIPLNRVMENHTCQIQIKVIRIHLFHSRTNQMMANHCNIHQIIIHLLYISPIDLASLRSILQISQTCQLSLGTRTAKCQIVNKDKMCLCSRQSLIKAWVLFKTTVMVNHQITQQILQIRQILLMILFLRMIVINRAMQDIPRLQMIMMIP